jgi:hypothetical protein
VQKYQPKDDNWAHCHLLEKEKQQMNALNNKCNRKEVAFYMK